MNPEVVHGINKHVTKIIKEATGKGAFNAPMKRAISLLNTTQPNGNNKSGINKIGSEKKIHAIRTKTNDKVLTTGSLFIKLSLLSKEAEYSLSRMYSGNIVHPIDLTVSNNYYLVKTFDNEIK